MLVARVPRSRERKTIVKDPRWEPQGNALTGSSGLMAGFTHICRLGIHSRGPAGGLRAVQDHSAGLSSKVPPSGSTSSSLSRVRLSDNYGSWPRVQHGERGDAPPSPPRDGPWRGRASPRWPRRSPICTGWQAASTARMRLPAEPSGIWAPPAEIFESEMQDLPMEPRLGLFASVRRANSSEVPTAGEATVTDGEHRKVTGGGKGGAM